MSDPSGSMPVRLDPARNPFLKDATSESGFSPVAGVATAAGLIGLGKLTTGSNKGDDGTAVSDPTTGNASSPLSSFLTDDRRGFLKKAGVGVGVAWAVPVILSSPAFAAGSGPSGGGPGCISCNGTGILNGDAESGVDNWTVVGNVTAFPYTGLIVDPPPSSGSNSFYLNTGGGSLAQTVIIDPGCVGQPFSFSFWSAQLGGHTITLAFQSGGSPVGAPTVLALPDTVFGGIRYPMALTTIPGTVPTGADSVTVTFASSQAVVDLVAFIICS